MRGCVCRHTFPYALHDLGILFGGAKGLEYLKRSVSVKVSVALPHSAVSLCPLLLPVCVGGSQLQAPIAHADTLGNL